MIRVGIVDDHPVVRSGLRDFLSEQSGIGVVGEASDGREALDLVRTVPIDVLVLDLAMPERSGIDSLAMIRARAPDTGILILSVYAEEQFAMNLIRQGARGYLNKESEPAEIVRAIRSIAAGRHYVSTHLAELLARQLEQKDERPAHEQLSDREFQVFLNLARGQTVGEVAATLSLSVKTVSTYRTRLMEKLALRSNSDLTYYALKNHLID